MPKSHIIHNFKNLDISNIYKKIKYLEKRDRAIQFSNQVKSTLNSEFDSNIDWEVDSAPNLKFVIKKDKKYEMMMQYNQEADSFLLYDRDAKTQRNETLGTFSPANITTPNDPTVGEVVAKVKSYAV